jgi:hypothetical protein
MQKSFLKVVSILPMKKTHTAQELKQCLTATKELIVSNPRDGGQSIMVYLYIL